MEALKTIAIIYEDTREALCKDVLTKLMFSAHCFTFIRVSSGMENSYTLSGTGGLSRILESKLHAAQELYVINPKGSIVPYMADFLSYAKENSKPVHYLYRFCYRDCTYRKGSSCMFSDEMYSIPREHKLLPSCKHYSRIYDNFICTSSHSAPAEQNDSPVMAEYLAEEEGVSQAPMEELRHV